MKSTGYSRIEQIVIEEGLVNREQLAELLIERKNSGKRLPGILIEKKFVSEDHLQSLIEEKLKIPRVNLNDYPVDPTLAGSIPPDTALKLKVIPLAKKEDRIMLAMTDPLDLAAIDEAAMITGAEIYPVMAKESSINHLLTQLYGFQNYDKQDIRNESGREKDKKDIKNKKDEDL
ncbi:MAG: hypothetical protein K0B84_11510, partial [Firmicutes bacterium]|nr:hypothetical protein [Bacillota bacterium]